MGRRSWMEDVKVAVEVVDFLPVYEFEALREIIKKVALRVMKELEEEEKSKPRRVGVRRVGVRSFILTFYSSLIQFVNFKDLTPFSLLISSG